MFVGVFLFIVAVMMWMKTDAASLRLFPSVLAPALCGLSVLLPP